MRIAERWLGDTIVLDLHGPLHGPEGTERLGAAVHRLASAGRPQLIVNLEGVPSIDAAGLGALADAYSVITRSGGTLRLAHLNKRLHDLVVITRLVTVFDIVDSVEDPVRGGSGVTPNPLTAGSAVPQLSQAPLGSIQSFLSLA